MIRAVPAIRRDPLAYLSAVVARYGDLVAFPMPRTPVLLVNDPVGAARVLQAGHRGYGKATIQYRSLAEVTGAGLLTADGEEWRGRRRLVQPAFHALHHDAPAQDSAGREATAAGERLRSEWDAAGGRPLDVAAAAMRATLGLVGRTLFDDDLAAEGPRLVGAVDVALHALVRRAASPLALGPLGRAPVPSRRRLRSAVAALDAAVADVVARRRSRGLTAGDADVLAVLLRAEDEGQLSRRQVRDELVTFVIAGHETVASCLTWTLHLLAGAPAVQERLRGHDVAYATAVVDEALRLYPPAWMISRRALADDLVAGVPVPAGTLVLISPWLLHRRAADWPDPERFRPARFLDGGAPGPASRGYVPFGAGPRLCIGRDLARTQVTRMLAAVLHDRTVARPAGAAPPRVDALVTLRPRGGLPLLLRSVT